MRKIFFAFLIISFAFAACDNGNDENLDDLKKENQELRDALAANSKITKVEFTATEMILTYSNGLKLTTGIPEVLRGKDGTTPKIGDNGNWWIGNSDTGVIAQGQNGTDGNSPFIGDNGNWWIDDTDTGLVASGADGVAGVGIQSIVFDEATGVMTITLTNGEESKFVINNTDGNLVANIMEDLNGKYLVKKITMGDIPYAEFEYNDDHQITKLTSYAANGYQTFKSFDVEKEYENALLVKVITRRYAKEKTTEYSDEYYENSITKEVEFGEYKGDQFIEENSDGSYYYYGYQWNNEGKYYYYRYYANKDDRLVNELVSNGDGTYTVYSLYSDHSVYNDETSTYDIYYRYKVYDKCFVYDEYQGRSEMSIKVANNQFKIYSGNSYSIMVEGFEEYRNIFYFRSNRTILGFYEVGDLMDETYSDLVYDSSNKVEKIYESKEEGVEATSYILNSYDGDNLAKIESFKKDADNWVKETKYLTFTYNSAGLLKETIEHDAEDTETVVAKVDYDKEGNPTEIFKHYGDLSYGDVFGYYNFEIINPETGLRYDSDDVYIEAGLHSVAKIEYNYTMKNFFGNTIAGLFPELYGFNFNNALKGVTLSNSVVAGAIEYKDFNEGGYPETMEFIGSYLEYGESYTGQLKVEYQKIED